MAPLPSELLLVTFERHIESRVEVAQPRGLLPECGVGGLRRLPLAWLPLRTGLRRTDVELRARVQRSRAQFLDATTSARLLRATFVAAR